MENSTLQIEHIERINKTITTIVIVLSGHCFYTIYKDLNYLIYIFRFQHFGFAEIRYLLFLILLPVALLFFHFKQKTGWILLTIYLVFGLTAYIVNFAKVLIYPVEEINTFYEKHNSIDAFGYLVALILFSSILFFVIRADLRNYFRISKKSAFITSSITCIFTLLTYII